MRGDEPRHNIQKVKDQKVYPTCVGMNRDASRDHRRDNCVYPTCVGMNRIPKLHICHNEGVYPTCVGMNRRKPRKVKRHINGIPHMRGDEPSTLTEALFQKSYTPHAWG